MFLNVMFNTDRLQTRSLAIALASSLVFAASLASPPWLSAQLVEDRLSVPLSDASRSGVVKANLVSGSISVKGYEGKEVIVEAHARTRESAGPSGMRRIPMTATGLSVEEENNRVQISADSHQRPIDLNITVPYRTSLILSTVNDGSISVTGVEGEFDVNDVNGSVTLTNISGNAVAHALNGRLLVAFNRVNPQKAMAFSSLNGNIDVTFPADLKANLTLSSDRGEVFSDFDVQLQARGAQPIVEDTRGQGGRYRVRIDKTIHGTISGGGQEIQFKNFNGNIYIRKAGKVQ